MDWLTLLFSFLGGGLISAVVGSLNTTRLESRRRQAGQIRSQLEKLYGPLHFLTSSNARLFEINRALGHAYDEEYIKKQYSEKYDAQARITERAKQTIELQNAYIEQVNRNNERIFLLLESHYSLIEPDDVEILMRFYTDFTRLRTERDESGKLITPLEIYEHIGEISFMRPEFIEMVENRFREKKAALEKLQVGWLLRGR